MTYDPLDTNENDNTADGDVEFTAVNTANASVTNAPSSDNEVLRYQEGVETAQIQADGLDNSSGNDDWGQAAFTNDKSTSWSTAFPSNPRVAFSKNNNIDNVPAHEYDYFVKSVSTTGITIKFMQVSSANNSGTTNAYGVDVIASPGR